MKTKHKIPMRQCTGCREMKSKKEMLTDKEADKKRSDWKLSVRWAWFIGENREPLKLMTKPEPYTLDRTLRWIQRQVDPTLKMLETITAKTGIEYLKEIRKSTKLTEKHYKIIEQQTTSTEDVILEKEN